MVNIRTGAAYLKTLQGHFGNDLELVLAAYNALVPAFEALFEAEGRDFERFYAAVKRLAALPKDERRATLQRYLH